ncbi:uncharacterized protein PG986_014431 [Apiospora aurea]|uniref:Protein kinase domain-containing protein n=1 Tax=Apiospora aurea TaxID=335848 RepID=A0ABR1PSZ9_9PEZI
MENDTLLKRLKELERRAEEADQRAEEAEQQRQLERQRAEEAEKVNRLTTLSEYLEACHEFVYAKFQVEPDKSLTSKGPTTNPQNKYCPTRLIPWSDFIDQQRTVFGDLYSLCPTETRAFESLAFLHGLGERIARKRIANEKDLEYFQHISVEDPVRSIVEHLVSVAEVRAAFALGDGIVFENHPNAISDISEEVVDRLATPQRPRTPDQPRFERLRLRPDQICIYRQEGETSTQRTMLYINEYKAPHKITPQHLRVGLRSMDIYKEVVNRATIPTAADPEALFQYHSERLVAAAITQTFHYMIEGGLEYGLVTTEEAIAFLKVDWSDPTTLLYHLAEPRAEVVAHPRDARYCRRYHHQDEREAVMSSLNTWSEDVETLLKSIPVDQRKAPSSSPAYEPDPYSDVDRSPCISRKRKPRKPLGNVTRIGVSAHSPESSDDESTRRMQETPTPLEPTRSGRIQAAQRALPNHTRKDGQDAYRSRQQNDGYCTEECLRGLTLQTKTRLDEKCPNVAAHRHDGDGLHHRISHARFVTLLRDQLKRTLDDGIESLNKGGARGVLFKVTLLAYGYTFIGKGTVPAFIEDLEHEAKVYQALQPLQGRVTPIFLGAIDLRTISRTYYYDFRVRVQYMMFLSWGGNSLDSVRTAGDDGDLSRQLIHAVRALHTCGVAHKDLRSPNVLINQETGQIRICDFERAVLMERPRLPLGSVVPNKRRLPTRNSGVGKMGRELPYKRQMREDLNAINTICLRQV